MMDLNSIKRIHLIGIGGTGLSAIARVLLERGYQVSGSDRQRSGVVDELGQSGARILIGHAAGNVHQAELVIRSSAVPDDNIEVVEAKRLGIPVVKRADFLGALMKDQRGIAVAGTHGKTTTTAMIAWMFSGLGLEPTFIIGGVSKNLGVNARAGKGHYFIIEADEYDRMFHGLKPSTAVVTNIEHDHPDCYPTSDDFFDAFVQFAGLVPAEGNLVVCSDDPGGARLAQETRLSCNVMTYGIDSGTIRAINPKINARGGYTFSTNVNGILHQVTLQVPGLHNVRNALAAMVCGSLDNVDLGHAADLLGEFTGTGRRFEVVGEVQGIVVIDDYGHHPTEIQVTLAAARARYPGRPIWAVWQPHTYSRTLSLASAFAEAFDQADHVIVTEIFASRESSPADGFSSHQVVNSMQHPDVRFIPELEEAADFLIENLISGDVLITFSAGDADQISRQVLYTLSQDQTLYKGQKNPGVKSR